MNLSSYTTTSQFEGESSKGIHNYRSWVPVGITRELPTLSVKFLFLFSLTWTNVLKNQPQERNQEFIPPGILKQTRL
jgi:hypothetical protein